MQAMPIKHGTGRCNLKKYAKRVLFKTNFAVFWAEKEVVEAPNRAQNTLNHDERCLFIVSIDSNANGPLHGHPRHPNCPKNGNFGPFSTNSETKVGHLRIPLPVATNEFLAQTLYDCTSHP